MQAYSAIATWRETRRRLIPATMVGTVLEWYDVFIYAQAAAFVLGPLFFPQFSATAATLAAFATFGIGYFARPLGAIIFGHVGDKYGRKVALMTTLLLMGTATTLIGVLPTYTSVGLAAPLLLVIFRLLQGVGAGAEYAGALVMVAEASPPQRRGFFAALPGSGIYIGVALSAGVSALVFTMPQEALLSWGWRLPFLASIVLIAVGLFFRLRIAESPVFAELEERRAARSLPVVTVFREAPLRLFLALLLMAPIGFNVYIALTYGLTYSVKQGASNTTALVSNVLGSIVAVISVPLAGFVSDKVGRRPVYMALALLSAAISFPFFWLLSTGQAMLIYVAVGVLMGGIVFAITGAQAAYLAELFDPAYRYSGVALTREIATAALASPAPVIAITLAAVAGGDPWLVAVVMVAASIACFIGVLALPETRAIDMRASAGSLVADKE